MSGQWKCHSLDAGDVVNLSIGKMPNLNEGRDPGQVYIGRFGRRIAGRQSFLPSDSTVINVPPQLNSGHRLFRETLYHDLGRKHVRREGTDRGDPHLDRMATNARTVTRMVIRQDGKKSLLGCLRILLR